MSSYNAFLTLALYGSEFPIPAALPTGYKAGWAIDSEEKNLCTYQELNPGHPAHILITILTELPQVL
jgi:hypothetical protein